MYLYQPPAPKKSQPGYHLHDPATGLHLYAPGWNHPTWFKPLGRYQWALPPASPENWFAPLPHLARAVGQRRRVTFLHWPSDLLQGLETPYEVLRRRAWELGQEERPQWLELFRRQHPWRASLPNLTRGALLQGWLYGTGGCEHWMDPDPQSLLLLSPGAIHSLGALLGEDEALLNDLLDPASPVLLQYYQAAWDYPLPAGWELVREGDKPSPDLEPGQGAGHLIARVVRPTGALPLPRPTEEHRQRLIPWDQVVRHLSVREQLALLRQAFGQDFLETLYRGTDFEEELAGC